MAHKTLIRFAPALALLLAGACAPTPPPARQQAAAQQPAGIGVVSAADPRAAQAGVEILRMGGSATDAAIATMLALNVVEPQNSGIGGGSFMVRHDARANTVSTIDGREAAPAAADPQWFFGPEGKPMPMREAFMGGRAAGGAGQPADDGAGPPAAWQAALGHAFRPPRSAWRAMASPFRRGCTTG